MKPFSFLFLITLFSGTFLYAQDLPKTTNYNEADVLPYILPDPLLKQNGERVKTADEWTNFQREHIYQLFEEHVYGRFPKNKSPITFEVMGTGDALNGNAVRKQIRLILNPNHEAAYVDVLLYLPKSDKPAPILVSLNFNGNAAITSEPEVLISENYQKLFEDKPEFMMKRGAEASSWPIDLFIENGIGIATAYYGDLEPDHPDGWKTGIRTSMQDILDIRAEEWGAIGAWAWGLTKIMDYFEMDEDINQNQVAVMGHSRLGKAALWAGASDTRFSIVISNESGHGGATLSRRWYGEMPHNINGGFPHWFADKYKSYNDDIFSLPIDQHELLALIAPRPLYVASASEDAWCDPKGEFLSAWHAGQVYALFDEKGLETGIMPAIDTSIGNTIRYHIRTGVHGTERFDWQQYIRFAKEMWGIK